MKNIEECFRLMRDKMKLPIKPCPFCGMQPKLEHTKINTNGEVEEYFRLYCDSILCNLEVLIEGSLKDEIIKQWNTRY